MSFFRKISNKITKIKTKLTADEEEIRRARAQEEAIAQERARQEAEEQQRLYPMSDSLRTYLTESGIINLETFTNFDQAPAECQQFHLGVQELQHIELAVRISPNLTQIRHTLLHNFYQSAQHFWSVYFMLISQVVERHRQIPYSPDYFSTTMCLAAPHYRSRLTHFDKKGTLLGSLGVAPPPGRLSTGSLEDYYYEHPARVPAQQPRPPAPAALAESVRCALGMSYISNLKLNPLDIKRIRNAEVLMDERAQLWADITGAAQFLTEQPDYFDVAEARVFGLSSNVKEENNNNLFNSNKNSIIINNSFKFKRVVWSRPSVRNTILFGAKYRGTDFDAAIGTSGKRDLRDILYMIAAEYGPEAFLPFLPDMVSLLLCAGMPKSETYIAASLLLARSFTRGGGIFPSGRAAQADECERFAGCVAECAPGVAAALRRRGLDPGLVGKAWIDRFFVGVLPLPTVLSVMDCFLADRSRAVLFRVAIALFQLVPIDSILNVIEENEFNTNNNNNNNHNIHFVDISPKDLLRAAYSIPISTDVVISGGAGIYGAAAANSGASGGGDRKNDGGGDTFLCDTEDFLDISRSNGPDRLVCEDSPAVNSRSVSPSVSPCPEGRDDIGDIGINDDIEDEDDDRSDILSDEQFESILDSWLPRGVGTMAYAKLFSTRRHGFSLSHLLRLCEGVHPVLIAVKSRAGNTFGAFLTAEIAKTGDKYAGTGESFVFTLNPEPARYGWSKRNAYFLAVGPRSLVVGGGGMGAALELDDELCLGASFRSATFENDPLDGGRTEFVVEDLEVYGFIQGDEEEN